MVRADLGTKSRSRSPSPISSLSVATVRKQQPTPLRLGYVLHKLLEPSSDPGNSPVRPHVGNIYFRKASSRKPHYEDGRTLNERRFDSIDTMPTICTRVGHLGNYEWGKAEARKDPPSTGGGGCFYNVDKSATLHRSIYSIFA